VVGGEWKGERCVFGIASNRQEDGIFKENHKNNTKPRGMELGPYIIPFPKLRVRIKWDGSGG